MKRRDFLALAGATAAFPRVGFAQASSMFNVRDQGAKGDGVSDDAPAINAAVRAAIATGEGATVFIPAGRYLLASVSQASARSIYAKAAAGIDLARQGGYAIKTHLLI